MDYVKETGNKKYDINGTYRDLAGLASVVAGALSLPAAPALAISKTALAYFGFAMTAVQFTIPQCNLATVYKGNIIKNLIMDCQSYTKYRPNETTGGIFVSWRRKEELPTGA